MKGVADAVERDEHLTLSTVVLSRLDYTLCSLFANITNKHATFLHLAPTSAPLAPGSEPENSASYRTFFNSRKLLR
jgi:hypothetical protein